MKNITAVVLFLVTTCGVSAEWAEGTQSTQQRLAQSTLGSILRCGLKPLPPLGCIVGPCACDQYGNCQWVLLCR